MAGDAAGVWREAPLGGKRRRLLSLENVIPVNTSTLRFWEIRADLDEPGVSGRPRRTGGPGAVSMRRR